MKDNKLQFPYFTEGQSDMFTFYRIPKLLFTSDYFKDLSTDAKVVYGLLLDRMSLSAKNHWCDNEGRIFVIYPQKDLATFLGYSTNKIGTILRSLDSETGIGLIERTNHGQGNPTIIYVKNFACEEIFQKRKNDTSEEKEQFSETQNLSFLNPQNEVSRNAEIEILETQNLVPNNTNINNTDNSDTISNPILSNNTPTDITSSEADICLDEIDDRFDSEIDRLDLSFETENTNATGNTIAAIKIVNKNSISPSENDYSTLLATNIDLCALFDEYPLYQDTIQDLYDLIYETLISKRQTIRIASDEFPAILVKNRFSKLRTKHISYVLDCFIHNTTKIYNIKQYLLTALYNAPTTFNGYITAKVQYDNPELTLD